MDKVYDWHFPLVRTHAGMLLGNGTVGAMVWGEGNVLRVTLGRADFWDRRGGTAWTEQMNYREIRRLLEAKDEAGIRAIFAEPPKQPGQPRRPTVLPLGRLELVFEESVEVKTGHLHIGTGEVVVDLQRRTRSGGAAVEHRVRGHATLAGSVSLEGPLTPNASEEEEALDAEQSAAAPAGMRVVLNVSMHAPVLHVSLPADVPAPTVRCVTAWEHCEAALADRGVPRPAAFEGRELSGWVQPRARPGDGPLCVGYRVHDREVFAAVEYRADPSAARAATQRHVDEAITGGAAKLKADNERWWADYWAGVPRVDVPHERLSFLYHYGMYKFAGLTAPQGVAATLQGPWIEEYQIPPWSSDYHFNINVQMCYWPAYAGNKLAHLRPIFDLVWSWRERMRDNARKFVGIEDGYVLPHAVSDECVVIGSFWTGTIDHACTGWVGKMMFDYYRMSGDVQFLRERAYPFMHGAMRVFEEMLEKQPDGSYVLPVSVSPEYGGAEMWAWGRNASFQVGCVHMLIENLLHACEVLGEQPRPVWREIQRGLPKACVAEVAKHRRIMLWEGQNLEESHRHHSHWAGLYPWDVIDLRDPHWRDVVHHTYNWWMSRGMGYWSGWCIPWAAMLHARVGSPDAAVALMEYWEHIYTNEGHGTLHDPKLPKSNVTNNPLTPVFPMKGMRGEIMQMDAGMAACAAVMDFLVHTRRGVHYLLQGVPVEWREVSVDGIRTEGGFLVGVSRVDGVVSEVRVRSELGETFRFANPWKGGRVSIHRGRQEQGVEGEILEVPTRRGEVVVLVGA